MFARSHKSAAESASRPANWLQWAALTPFGPSEAPDCLRPSSRRELNSLDPAEWARKREGKEEEICPFLRFFCASFAIFLHETEQKLEQFAAAAN